MLQTRTGLEEKIRDFQNIHELSPRLNMYCNGIAAKSGGYAGYARGRPHVTSFIPE